MRLEPLPARPFVSAFALTYNHEDYIAEAIESVLAEKWPADRFEFVLLDDGSTDATPERVKPYLSHLTYIRQENQGIHRAVERLMGSLKGDVLIPCSGDDAWCPGRIELTVERMRERPDVGLSYGDMEVIDGSGRRIAPSFLRAAVRARKSIVVAGRSPASCWPATSSAAARSPCAASCWARSSRSRPSRRGRTGGSPGRSPTSRRSTTSTNRSTATASTAPT